MLLIHLKIIFHCRLQRTPEFHLNTAEQICPPETSMFSENPTPYLYDYEKHFIKAKTSCPTYVYSIRQRVLPRF